MVKNEKAVLQTPNISLKRLYNNYGAMLFGYIFEVVKDKNIAEYYLERTFKSVALKFDKINWHQSNNWCTLQRLAKAELIKFYEAAGDCNSNNAERTDLQNKYLDKMTEAQRLVFCNVYYNKKTTLQLAKEINKTEDLVKKLLREAFAIIRKTDEN